MQLPENIQSGIERIQTLIIERKMSDAEIRIFIFIVFVVPHNNRRIIPQPVTAHKGKVILKGATAHRIAPTLVLGKSVSTRINEVIDSPAAIPVLKATVNS